MTYAKDTRVPVERTRSEIERLVQLHGATGYASGWDRGHSTVMFKLANRSIRFDLDVSIEAFNRARRGKPALKEPKRAYEQWCRERWRALLLVVKGKLEAVAAGVTTVEEEFLAHIVMPNGQRVGDWLGPELAAAYERNEMPAMPSMLPGGSA